MTTLLVVKDEPLFSTPNGAVYCGRHVSWGDTGAETVKMDKVEAADWRGYILSECGPDASPCEGCRYGEGFVRSEKEARR